MTKDEAWDMIDSALDHCYPEKDVLEIKKTLAKQDAETNLQAVSDFGQLQALSEPSECWDCRCLQENEQDNDVICDLCRWAKEALAQPEQLHSTNNFCMTDEHVEILATMLHCVPCEEPELQIDLNAFCHDARTSIIKTAQPAQEQSCDKQDVQRHHDYVCGFNEGYDRAEKFYNKGAKS